MDRLIYTATAGAQRVMQLQASHANNLANVDTAGFRADLELVSSQALGNIGNTTRVFPTIDGQMVSMGQGKSIPTGRTLDLAIVADGWFTVQTEGGEAYTRNGAISLDNEGTLQLEGLPVVGENGPIVLPEHKDVFVGDDGMISIIPAEDGPPLTIDKLKLVAPDPAQFRKGLDGLLRGADGEAFAANAQVAVISGFLEGSNVDAFSEITAAMDLNRQFEVQVKMMSSAEQLAKVGNSLLTNAG
ncbi:flagellar basal body rod protein FlgF [Ferrimonas lipolytica]|uniref:Flagellar basal-body rod protein FlgF n=1 Tax=Ferrimonas lipolytica TaxID=2724191 RepID=A0A6H1UEZ8_9GAMM|nr:flagellar basal body rod protein FlgF [Ferrimonas lipolytica]QIZ76786.1 flagellar basal body rod protein FlgF [Ferrimonas lipolytica]